MDQKNEITEKEKKIIILNSVFSPSAPINSRDLFQGRKEQLYAVHSAVMEKGEHAIIHGDRGVGKTSLANIFPERYIGAKVVKFTCNPESSLKSIWFSVFRKIKIVTSKPQKRQAGFCQDDEESIAEEESSCLSDLIDKEDLDIDKINYLLEEISTNERLLIVIDEFDQIKAVDTRKSFANIIKYLSDNAVNITILLVGIGHSITDLLIEHESIERCLRQIKLDRMTDTELEKILIYAEKELEIVMARNVKANIVSYSNGFPHFAHLMGKYVFQEAINDDSSTVKMKHFARGLKIALNNVNESIKNAYEKAITSHKCNAMFSDVLFACAYCKVDKQNTFKSSDLETIFKEKLGYEKKQQSYQYHLGKLCSEERGKILESINDLGPRKRYRFSNPLMKAYIRLQYQSTKGREEEE